MQLGAKPPGEMMNGLQFPTYNFIETERNGDKMIAFEKE